MPAFIPVDFDPFAELKEIEKITFTNEPQREIWLSCIIGGDDANLSYNESVSLAIKGKLDFDALKKAVDHLVKRHEALRATISPNGETLIIYKDLQIGFELTDLSQSGDAEQLFKSFLQTEINIPLDIKEGPLFKVFLHQIANEQYYFTIIKHHVIGDGWSTGIILEDLSKMYNAYIKGIDIELDPASQLSDYASAQAGFKLSNAYKQTEDFWLGLYKDHVPVLDMPTDHPRVSPRGYKGNRIDHPMANGVVNQIKAVGAKAGCSLVTTLLAAFEVFIYQETRQKDIVVGLPSSGQAASGLTDVVGHCVNLLPLKTYVDPALSFTNYLKKRKTEVLDAYDHQRLTFGELIKKLYIPRDASRITLVPVMFNVDMGMDNAVAFDGLNFTLISNPRAYENFEIYLNATRTKDGIVMEWSYNTGLFEAATIENFISHYQSIIEQVIANPNLSIAEISGVADQEPSLSVAINTIIPPNETINSLFNKTVRQYADKTAVSFGNTSLSYQQLDQQANKLAAYLVESGIGLGDIVGLSVDRSIEMLVCLLAVLKTGAVYLPLDPEYPLERIEFMLQDSSAKMLLVSSPYKKRYQTQATEVVLDELWPELNNYQNLPAKEINGRNLAYILYTSGSTGKPKGVKITHLNLVNFLLSMQAKPGIRDTDRLLAITTISFDIAGLELYLPLISGAELVIADSEATRDGRLLLNIVESKQITIMQATPSTWQMMLDSGWARRFNLKILSGGEALPKDLADKLLNFCTELWNMYGPTETTIWSTIKQILPHDKFLTIGLPINNTQVYIIDEQGKHVNPNIAGEIYIGGDGVAEGYLNRAELTAEKFVADTFSNKPKAKLYRTGDLGKILDNGEIQCLGRIDHQVKIRGHRIELGEIETAIAQQDGIKQAVVLAREDSPMDKRLIAYVTLNEGITTNETSAWKDRWDALYDLGAENKQELDIADQNIDGTLLQSLDNSEELQLQSAEWLRNSIARIKELGSKRIYEIGSGAGQILFELAPGTESYIATDYAQTAINKLNEQLKADAKKWSRVKAQAAPADDFSAVQGSPIDLVLIHSVAQYFPDADYLIAVIKESVKTIKQAGCIFVGDMQGKNSLEMFHAMDQLRRSSDTNTVSQFNNIVANRVRIEEEFTADPAFFYSLPKLFPKITGVDVQLRKGQLLNETTNYHYDVWLYVNTPIENISPQITADWKDVSGLNAVEQLLIKNPSIAVGIKHIPNSRTAPDHRLIQLLLHTNPDAKLALIKQEVENAHYGADPDTFWDLAAKLNHKAHVRWTSDGTDGLFDVVFIPNSKKIVIPEFASAELLKQDLHNFARTPGLKNEIQLLAEVIKQWKSALTGHLPAYMVPEDFIALKNFPLTPNAKIDRKALPKPTAKQNIDDIENNIIFTPNEQLVKDIWAEVLGLENLKPTDDFFQLGGHSLLAVKVMVAIEKRSGKRLSIATLFNNSTIEKLAKQLNDDHLTKKWDALVPIKTAGSKTPVFLIHGGGLNILLFKSLSDHLDADQPVYGIQALGLNHDTTIPLTLEGIAKRYIDEIISVNPDGPYAIVGYSLGGFIAFEIGKQLQAMGKQIKLLGIVDTYAGGNTQQGSKLVWLTKKIMRQFRKVPFYSNSFFHNPKEAIDYQIIAIKNKINQALHPDAILTSEIATEHEKLIYNSYNIAHNAYLLNPADIKITLFKVAKRLYYLDEPKYLVWNKFAKLGIEVHVIPGDHKTFLFAPNDKQFASIIQQVLDK